MKVFLAFIESVVIYTCCFETGSKNRKEPAWEDGAIIWLLLSVIVVFGALYSDWVLAVVLHNLSDYPYDELDRVVSLWWLYMVGKRLNLLMV